MEPHSDILADVGNPTGAALAGAGMLMCSQADAGLSRSGRHILESHRDAAEGWRPGLSPQLAHNSISYNNCRPASIAFYAHRQMMLTPGRPSTYADYVQNDFGPFLCHSIGVLLQEVENLGLVASLVIAVPR
jgi:hypothetical protein